MAERSEPDPRRIVRAAYDRIADRYASWVRSAPTDTTVEEHLATVGERLPAGALLLDLGCGSGHRLLQLADRFTITAVDISFEQVRHARKLLPHARILQADMTRLEFVPTSFDAVTSLYAFNHLPFGELPGLLNRIAGWLRPGGLLVANMGTTWNPGSFEADWLGAPTYFSGYDAGTNRALLEAAGFQLVTARDETLWETIGGQTRPARFFWVVAQRPISGRHGPSTSLHAGLDTSHAGLYS